MAFTATITDAHRSDNTLTVEVLFDNGVGWSERRQLNFNDPNPKLVDVQAQIIALGTAIKASQAGEAVYKGRIGTVIPIP